MLFKSMRWIAPVGAFLLALSAMALVPATAQDATPEPAAAPTDPVLASVGGEEIHQSDLIYAAEDLGENLGQIPPEQQGQVLLDMLINMKVMAQAARAAGMDETETFKSRQLYLEERALRRAYFEQAIAEAVTDAEIQAAYDEWTTSFVPEEEVRARHILVATEEDARTVLTEIQAGRAFEDLAQEKSADGSAARGGDLGYFGRGQMVQPFEDAAFSLEVGAVSQPVESQFGWHLIKVEDKRMSSPPQLAELASQIRQQLVVEKFDAVMADLRANVAIAVAGPDGVLVEQTPTTEEAAPEESE